MSAPFNSGSRFPQGGPPTFNDRFNYYDIGDRRIETRNGSDQTLKQQVWGVQYVDELVQVALNQDPFNADDGVVENVCERRYWAMQDVNFNVLGLISSTGRLVERYEYTPYGQRTVFTHGIMLEDLNDDGWVGTADYAIIDTEATPYSRADVNGDGIVSGDDYSSLDFASGGGAQLPIISDPLLLRPSPYGSFRGTFGFCEPLRSPATLCEFGHQGLMHDEESGLVYNRARQLHPVIGRFIQRDPLGYHDSQNLHEYLRSAPQRLLDPSGLTVNPDQIIDVDVAILRTQKAEEEAIARNGGTTWSMRNGYLTIFDALNTEFWPGGSSTGKNGFVYTCKCGWIDLGHFFWMAKNSVQYGGVEWAERDGKQMEWLQNLIRRTVGGKDMGDSANTPEDRSSNRFGARFGFEVNQAGTEAHGGYGWSVFETKIRVSERLKKFLQECGAVKTRGEAAGETEEALKEEVKSWQENGKTKYRFKCPDKSLDWQKKRPIHAKLCDGDSPKQ